MQMTAWLRTWARRAWASDAWSATRHLALASVTLLVGPVRPAVHAAPPRTGTGAGRLLRLGRARRRAAVERRVRRRGPARRREIRPSNAGRQRDDCRAGVDSADVRRGSTGNFTGTTDEIIQWAACKWGFDEDTLRAQVAKESYWMQRPRRRWATTATSVPGHPRCRRRAGQCPSRSAWQVAQLRDDVPASCAHRRSTSTSTSASGATASRARTRGSTRSSGAAEYGAGRRLGLHRQVVLRPLVHQPARRRTSPPSRTTSTAHLDDLGLRQLATADHGAAATTATSTSHSGRASAGTVTSVDAATCPAKAASRAAITGPRSLPTTT